MAERKKSKTPIPCVTTGTGYRTTDTCDCDYRKRHARGEPGCDFAEEAAVSDFETYRLLPYVDQGVYSQCMALGMEKFDRALVFVSLCIGPSTGDLHAAASVMLVPKLPGFRVLGAFAISQRAYIALCEGIRVVCMPFMPQETLAEPIRFEGEIAMLTATQPYRVEKKLPFYTHIDPERKVN